MSDLLGVLIFGVGAYIVLGVVKANEQNAAIVSCGGAQQVTLLSGSGGCAALNAVNTKWSWYPQFSVSL